MSIIPKEIKYIESTKEWVIDGKVISEERLTATEKENLRALSKNYDLLISNYKPSGNLIY